MTRREAERLIHQQDTLRGLGFTREEAEQLRRISRTLQRWFEHECNGVIQRDEVTEKPYAVVQHYYRGGMENRYPVADRETGARKRLAAIVALRNGRAPACQSPDGSHDHDAGYQCRRCGQRLGPLTAYVQTDPRGAALYILRPGDVLDDLFTVEEIIRENAPSVFGVFRTGEPRSTGGKLTPRQTYGMPFDTREDAIAFAQSQTVQSYYTRGICVY